VADGPYGEFYDFYSVSPENFGSTLVHSIKKPSQYTNSTTLFLLYLACFSYDQPSSEHASSLNRNLQVCYNYSATVFYSNLKYMNFKDCSTKNINEVSLYAQNLKMKFKKLKICKWEGSTP